MSFSAHSRGGVLDAAREDYGAFLARIGGGQGGQLGFRLQRSPQRRRERRELGPGAGVAGQGTREQRDQRDLGEVGLGGGDGPLGSGLQAHHVLGGRRELGGGIVGEGDRQRPLGPGVGEHRHHVGGAARLQDPEHQGLREAGRGPVERGARGGREGHREAVARPQDVLGVDRGVIRGPPCGDQHELDPALVHRLRERLDRPLRPREQPPDDLGSLEEFAAGGHGCASRGVPNAAFWAARIATWQATRWPASNPNSSGATSRQICSANGHRG